MTLDHEVFFSSNVCWSSQQVTILVIFRLTKCLYITYTKINSACLKLFQTPIISFLFHFLILRLKKFLSFRISYMRLLWNLKFCLKVCIKMCHKYKSWIQISPAPISCHIKINERSLYISDFIPEKHRMFIWNVSISLQWENTARPSCSNNPSYTSLAAFSCAMYGTHAKLLKIQGVPKRMMGGSVAYIFCLQ